VDLVDTAKTYAFKVNCSNMRLQRHKIGAKGSATHAIHNRGRCPADENHEGILAVAEQSCRMKSSAGDCPLHLKATMATSDIHVF